MEDFPSRCFATPALLLFAAPVAGFVEVAWRLTVVLAPCLVLDDDPFCDEEECVFFDACPFAEPDSRAFSPDAAAFVAANPRRERDA